MSSLHSGPRWGGGGAVRDRAGGLRDGVSDAARQLGSGGVKALAAVTALVAVAAAVLAWQARPEVEPLPPKPAVGAASGPTGAVTTAGAEVVVAVSGRVRRPGLVRLPAGARVADAIEAAGGALPGTDLSMINLARKVTDGELIAVGITPPPGSSGAPGAGGGPVNLNTASAEQLQTLPGVGPVLAQRIIDYRDQHGGFASVSDLRKVTGIGDVRYQELKDRVTV